jgi:hypothetical protein
VVVRPKTHFTQKEYLRELSLRKYYGMPEPEYKPGEKVPEPEEIIELKTMI